MPTELKHCTGQSAEIVLIESPAWPRFAIEACRPDGIFLLGGTDDQEMAEAIYLQASLTM